MPRRLRTPRLALAALCLGAVAAAAFAAAPETVASDPLAGLKYRLLGPAAGGRVSRVAGVAGDPLVYWAATAAGGVWKTVNGGLEWKSVFDDQPVSSTGSIAVAPSDPNVVYVGSGEANIRGNVAEGNGIYKTTDGGKTWSRVWEAEGQIGTMIVHPRDADVAFAAVLGSPFGPGPERGVYRTTDGGSSWDRVLFEGPDAGASDVCFDPSNPRILFAGLWQTRRTPWGMTSGGPRSGLFVSRDGGDTWKRLSGSGLPAGPWGKVGVRVAPSDPRRVYALIEAEEGGLFRSDDGGESWKRINPSRGLTQRSWYYMHLTIDPRDPDVVWFPQVPMLKTVDGGERVRQVKAGGWDYHDVWIDPLEPRRIVVGSDAGVSLSRDGGETWHRPPLPISQLYHLTTDARRPYRVLATLQDWGTVSGPSNSLHGGGVLLSDWHPVGGGEAGHIAADPSDPDIVWAGEYLGFISRYDGRTGTAPHVGIYPDNGSGWSAEQLRYRFQWTAPIAISPHDPQTVYHGANVLLRTRDGGATWQAISPDLTRDDESKQQWAGGPITGDNTGVEFYDTIFAVAESPVTAGVIWAGSDDGLVHVTRDGGGSWKNVTPKGIPEWATVSAIEASRWDAGTAYVVVDAHRLDDESPYLWKTDDYGVTWRSLAGALEPEIYLHVLREDTVRRGLLFAGSERGVVYSPDDGTSWRPLDLNMPTVAVVDLVVEGDDLVVGTLGRSIWVLDDLTPVREMSEEVAAAAAHLFAPRPAVRWRYASTPNGSRDGAGENPPAGAIVHYHLAEEPEGEVTLEVFDGAGRRVRRLSSVAETSPFGPDDPDTRPDEKIEADLGTKPGVQRAAWDLAWEGAERIPGAKIDIGDPYTGPLALPGEYTLRLTVEGETYERRLAVEPDPRSPASSEDLAGWLDFALRVRDRMTEIARMAKTIRGLGEQLEERGGVLAREPRAADLIVLGGEIADRLRAIEERIHNPEAEVAYDILAGRAGGAKLLSRLSWLFEGLRDLDRPPTQGMREVEADLAEALAGEKQELERLIAEDLAELNARAAELGIPYVVAQGETE